MLSAAFAHFANAKSKDLLFVAGGGGFIATFCHP